MLAPVLGWGLYNRMSKLQARSTAKRLCDEQNIPSSGGCAVLDVLSLLTVLAYLRHPRIDHGR